MSGRPHVGNARLSLGTWWQKSCRSYPIIPKMAILSEPRSRSPSLLFFASASLLGRHRTCGSQTSINYSSPDGPYSSSTTDSPSLSRAPKPTPSGKGSASLSLQTRYRLFAPFPHYAVYSPHSRPRHLHRSSHVPTGNPSIGPSLFKHSASLSCHAVSEETSPVIASDAGRQPQQQQRA